MRYKTAPVKNVARLSAAGSSLMNRAQGMPGMGLIWGKTGYGKTTASTWFVTSVNGVYVRAMATSTPASLLSAIGRELDCAVRGSCAQQMDEIASRLTQSGRPLFVDEADHIADSKRMTESLRDLHDIATVPVVLIGMASIKQKLARREQLFGRISQWVEFQPLDIEDAALLARELCEVEVAEDLLGQLHAASEGSARLLVVGLGHIEHFARTRGLDRITAAKWTGEFLLDTAPTTRKRTPFASALKVARG